MDKSNVPKIVTVKAEGSLNADKAATLCMEMQAADADLIQIDISNMSFAHPFESVVIASQVRHMQSQGQKFRLLGYDQDKQSHTYLAHIGFFKMMKFNIGNKPGEATGNSNYFPITIFNKSDLEFEEIFDDVPVQQAIENKSNELAKVLTQAPNYPRIWGPVSYCFRELIRNVFEHSGTEECMLAGQSYKGRVEVAIVDCGRGLRKSLAEKHTVERDVDAVLLAIQPGISRAFLNPQDTNKSDWANSGFGLYVLHGLGERCGKFTLMSGDTMLYKSQTNGCVSTCNHVGTAVSISFTKPEGIDMQEIVSQIIEAGERQIDPTGKRKVASRSSRVMGEWD